MYITNRNRTIEMILSLLKDPWTFVSMIGMSMVVAINWIATHINPIIAMMAGVLGLVMLVLGIIEKVISIRASLEKKKRNQTLF